MVSIWERCWSRYGQGVAATLTRRHLDSTLTPLQMLRALRHQDRLVGLVGGWHDGAAVIAFAPRRRLSAGDDPFEALRRVPTLSDSAARGFGGGWMGTLGYRLGSRVEHLPPAQSRPVPVPDFSLAYYDSVLTRDADGWWLEALGDEAGSGQVDRRLRLVESLIRRETPESAYRCGSFLAIPGGTGHRAAVDSALSHIRIGDIFQANICRRFEASYQGDPLDAFCTAVDRLTPKYAAFVRTDDGAIASLSPELFLRRTGDRVVTSPIKGTAPLDTDPDEALRRRRRTARRT